MKKFNGSFVADKTIVQFFGRSLQWYRVSKVSEARARIKVGGLAGSFRRELVQSFSNTKDPGHENMLNTFRVDGSSLFELKDDGKYHFVYCGAKCKSKAALVLAYLGTDHE